MLPVDDLLGVADERIKQISDDVNLARGFRAEATSENTRWAGFWRAFPPLRFAHARSDRRRAVNFGRYGLHHRWNDGTLRGRHRDGKKSDY